MNEEGYSWPEAVLTLAVIMIVFVHSFPLATTMTSRLHLNKMECMQLKLRYKGLFIFKHMV